MRQYQTYLYIYIPEQSITGVSGLEKLEPELHLIATVDEKFDGLMRDIATKFNREEQKQTSHVPRRLIVCMASCESFAKQIAETKI